MNILFLADYPMQSNEGGMYKIFHTLVYSNCGSGAPFTFAEQPVPLSRRGINMRNRWLLEDVTRLEIYRGNLKSGH